MRLLVIEATEQTPQVLTCRTRSSRARRIGAIAERAWPAGKTLRGALEVGEVAVRAAGTWKRLSRPLRTIEAGWTVAERRHCPRRTQSPGRTWQTRPLTAAAHQLNAIFGERGCLPRPWRVGMCLRRKERALVLPRRNTNRPDTCSRSRRRSDSRSATTRDKRSPRCTCCCWQGSPLPSAMQT